MKRVLIVEDDNIFRGDLAEYLTRKGFEVFQAGTLNEAREKFGATKEDLALICLDGCIEANEIDTLPLIRFFLSEGFTGLIIAMSSDEHYRNCMWQGGCSHQSKKPEVFRLAFQLLK